MSKAKKLINQFNTNEQTDLEALRKVLSSIEKSAQKLGKMRKGIKTDIDEEIELTESDINTMLNIVLPIQELTRSLNVKVIQRSNIPEKQKSQIHTSHKDFGLFVLGLSTAKRKLKL